MSRRIFIGLASAVIMAMLSLAANALGVGAVGPPTDNTTTLDSPTDNQTSNEIKPLVNYVLQGPTAQSPTSVPSVVTAMTGPSGQPQSAFTSADTWYLNMDINVPGWAYIYEFYPQGSASPGRWIAYKWQMEKSGQWRFGPFTPSNSEPEGQHSFGIWFYGDGKWAGEGAGVQKGYLVSWTFAKSPAVPVTPPPTTPVKEASGTDGVFDFMVQRAVVFIPLILLIAVLVAVILYRRRAARELPDILLLPGEVQEVEPITSNEPVKELELPAAVNAPRAKLSLPNGADILFSGKKFFGRGDLSRALEIDQLGLISRKHFEISFKDDKYFVEDLGGANGTKLNGSDIGGKGPVALSDNDVIEPAAAIKLKFCLI